MDTNPYAPPAAADETRTQGVTMRYRVFDGQPFAFKLSSSAYRDEVRREAERTIAEEIGAENVLSIIEHGGLFEPFTVVVWYRTRSPKA